MATMKDSLQVLPTNKWDELQNELKSDWPRCISCYYILEIQRKWLEKGLDYGFKIFCPFGDVRGGVVAIHQKVNFYEIFIDCPSNDTDLLEEALKKTEVINWKDTIVVMFAQSHIVDCITRISRDLNVVLELSPLQLYVLDKESAAFDISPPTEFTFRLLSPVHIELIDSKWAHRYPGSTSYFGTLIQKKFGYGLFKEEQLISWVFVKETGALGHLYTLEEYRRNGYGEMTLKLLCNVLLKRDMDVFSYILQRNTQSCKLHERLRFKRYSGLGSCHLKSKEK